MLGFRGNGQSCFRDKGEAGWCRCSLQEVNACVSVFVSIQKVVFLSRRRTQTCHVCLRWSLAWADCHHCSCWWNVTLVCVSVCFLCVHVCILNCKRKCEQSNILDYYFFIYFLCARREHITCMLCSENITKGPVCACMHLGSIDYSKHLSW